MTVNEVTINDKRNRMEFQEVIDVDCENQLNSAESIKSKSQRNLTTIKRTRTKKRRLTEIESLFKLIDNYPLK